MRLKNKHFSGLQMMSSWLKPLNFSDFLLLISNTWHDWLQPHWNIPFLASVALPFPGFLPCPQMLMFCWIPFLTLAPFQVSLTGLTTPSMPTIPKSLPHLPWASDPCSQLSPMHFHLNVPLAGLPKPVPPLITSPVHLENEVTLELSHLKPFSIQLLPSPPPRKQKVIV